MSVQREYTVRKAEIKDDQQMICTYFSSENEGCTKGLTGGINLLGNDLNYIFYSLCRVAHEEAAQRRNQAQTTILVSSTNTEKRRYFP